MQAFILIVLIYCVMTVALALARHFLDRLDIRNKYFYIAALWLLTVFWLNSVMAAIETVLYGAPVINEKDIYVCGVVAGFMTWLYFKI